MLLAKSSRRMCLGIGFVLLVMGCAPISGTPIPETPQPSPSPLALTMPPVQNTATVEATVQFMLDQSLTEHRGGVEGLAFSPDGRTLASIYKDGKIVLWDVNTRQSIRSFAGGGETGGLGMMLGFAFSPDGKILAAMSSGTTGSGQIELFNVDTRQPFEAPLGGDVQFSSMAFSPDGKFMALGAIGGVIYIWDVQSHQVFSELRGETGMVASVIFSPNGKTLASQILVPSSENDPQKIVLWDMDSLQTIGQPLTGQSAMGREVGLISMAFSPDSMTLASGTDDGVIILWNIVYRRTR